MPEAVASISERFAPGCARTLTRTQSPAASAEGWTTVGTPAFHLRNSVLESNVKVCWFPWPSIERSARRLPFATESVNELGPGGAVSCPA
jgi:hypothetical protein